MNYELSFTLTEEQKSSIENVLAEGKEKYSSISRIICESEVGIGHLFESDIEEGQSHQRREN